MNKVDSFHICRLTVRFFNECTVNLQIEVRHPIHQSEPPILAGAAGGVAKSWERGGALRNAGIAASRRVRQWK